MRPDGEETVLGLPQCHAQMTLIPHPTPGQTQRSKLKMFTSLWMGIAPQTMVLLQLSGRCQDHHLLHQDVPPALPQSTSLPQPHPPAWTALLVALARLVVGPLAALAALLASMLQLGSAPPALPPPTSLPQPRPPA